MAPRGNSQLARYKAKFNPQKQKKNSMRHAISPVATRGTAENSHTAQSDASVDGSPPATNVQLLLFGLGHGVFNKGTCRVQTVKSVGKPHLSLKWEQLRVLEPSLVKGKTRRRSEVFSAAQTDAVFLQ